MYNTSGPMGLAPRSGAEYLYSALAPEQYSMFRNMENMLLIVTGWLGLFTETFVRHSFGERYLNPGRVLMACLILQLWTGIMSLIHFTTRPLDFVMNRAYQGVDKWLIWAFLGFSIWHLIQIWRRRAQNEAWHSRSFGISRLNPILLALPSFNLPLVGQVRIGEAAIYRILEPLICYLAILFFTDGPMQTFMTVSCLSMAIHSHLVYSTLRERHLDQVDRQIETYFYLPGGTHRNIRIHESAGHHVIPLPSTLHLAHADTDIEIPSQKPQPQTVEPVAVIPAKGDNQ